MQINIYQTLGAIPQLVHGPVEFSGPIELGRQNNPSEALYQFHPPSKPGMPPRLVIAEETVITLGRRHVFLEPSADGTIRITDNSTASDVWIADRKLAKSKPHSYPLPAEGLTADLGRARLIKIIPSSTAGAGTLESMKYRSIAPGQGKNEDEAKFVSPSESAARLLRLKVVLDALQNTLVSSDFHVRTARAMTTVAQMDTGHVLLRSDDKWVVETSVESGSPMGLAGKYSLDRFSTRVLSNVWSSRMTFYQHPSSAEQGTLEGVTAVVASPILDPESRVIGLLYGDRRRDGRPITPEDAVLVELLAGVLANGLARLKTNQTLDFYKQFFPPKLAEYLVKSPKWLDARPEQVTILFCDIRKFSYYSVKLGAKRTMAWINEVLEALTKCVVDTGGVVVDYVGDELMAMWGAPESQQDHASRGYRAALAMMTQRDVLNAHWQHVLGAEMDFGIGINTGEAFVGNTGSTSKFKYGPQGHTVNLASRVQGATKYLRARLLITEATWEGLDASAQARTRRLCTLRVVNIPDPVTLYQVASPDQEPWPEWRENYERAREAFEAGNFRIANLLSPLYEELYHDDPSIVLLARSINALAHGAPPGHPILTLESK